MGPRFVRRCTWAALAALLIAGCGSSSATLPAGQVSPAAAASSAATGTAQVGPDATAVASAVASAEASAAESAKAAAAATATTVAMTTPAPAATKTPPPATPVPVTPAPTPDPALRAAKCTGTLTQKRWFANVAMGMSWKLYCGAFGSGWTVTKQSYSASSGGSMGATYSTRGATAAIAEGNFCSGAACNPGTFVDTATFAGMNGKMHKTTTGFAIYVNPGTRVAYTLATTGLTADETAKLGAAMVLVPKS